MRTNEKTVKVETASRRRCQHCWAYTLVELLVSSFLAAIFVAAGIAGITQGFKMIRVDRENSRAGQILLEKTELIRLYTWDQINNGWGTNTYVSTNASVPATFTSPFYPDTNNGGFNYSGTVTVTNAPITETYAADLRQVQISLVWTSSFNVAVTQSMTTLVSKYGLQNYIY